MEPLTYQSEPSLLPYQKVKIKLRNRELFGCVAEEVAQPEFKTLSILESMDECFSSQQYKSAKFIADYYFSSLGEALGLFIPFLDGEEGREKREEEITKGAEVGEIVLSKKQDEALAFLRQHKVSLLFGDTGSGKTEIYMKYFSEILQDEKRVLFLMPEISLTPQMQIRLEKFFGEMVVMWHSKLTKKQKTKNLEAIYDGSAKIIAGPRSALFLPIKDLGLIIVDEEHDESYKSSSRPRYQARDMAIYTASQLKIPVVLGSATPSLTSYAKFPHFRLKGGHFGAKRNVVFEPHKEEITPLIEHSVAQMSKQGDQGMVFIPTRANFKYLICDACGFTYECPFCSVGMSVHRNTRTVQCHYCNYSEAIPQKCPKCSHGDLVSSRLGTAEATSYFKEHYSHIAVEQFDRDVITTQNKLKSALKRFNDGKTDLLVGTQMLSKGHDYHDVTLAVVLGLDNILNMSDYRAREKALSLLIQIAGRSGRKKEALVLVQSFNEDFFAPYIEYYEQFLKEEMLFREGMYPPYKKLCRVLFAHKYAEKARDEMEQMQARLAGLGTVVVVGAGVAPIERIAGKYRFQILLRADKSTDIIRAVRSCKTELAEIDMDPVEFN